MMHAIIDPFDPRNWHLTPPHEFRIYGDDDAQTYGIVDEIDYHFLVQWKWSWKVSRGGRKRYLRRVVQRDIAPEGEMYDCPETGRLLRNRKRIQQTLFMHTMVMIRTGAIPPSERHVLVDHKDGDDTNYRRYNLRYATHSMNRRNIFGSVTMELVV